MTTVFLCRGSDCRQKKLSKSDLADALDGTGTKIRIVRCQKVCKSPVVGTDALGSVEWFRRMDSGKALRALANLVREREIGPRLEKRHAKKRSGKLR